ncbi:hypothetical protein BC829DRAFT_414876 [Chytridium lagenaria]|nr:hypothetical protein BC829DRAFT_414876 [Chytridium lagenaria]
MFEASREVLVVGLNQSNAGRRCDSHPDGCGKYLKEGDFVTFQASQYYDEKDGSQKPCSKCRVLRDYEPGCVVGMLSALSLVISDYDGFVGVVSRLRASDSSKSVRRSSYVKNSAADVRVIEGSPLEHSFSGHNTYHQFLALRKDILGSESVG